MSTFASPQRSSREASATAPAGPTASISGRRVGAHSLLRLQRTIGNRAVQRLLRADAEQAEDGSVTPGYSAQGHGADHMADGSAPSGHLSPTPPASAPASLPADLVRKWSHLVPFDLAEVRVHAGSGADGAARTAGTLAYSAGRDIVLSDRARRDEAVLAHEVVHVAQQRGARAARAVPRARDAALERDASEGAARLLRSQPLGSAAPAPVGAYGLDAGRREYHPGDLAALKRLLEGKRLFEAGQTSLAVSLLRSLPDAELQAIARDWEGDLSLTLARALRPAEWAEIEPRLGPYVSLEAEVAAGPHEATPERVREEAIDEGEGPRRYEVDRYLAQGVAELDAAQVLAQSSGGFTLIVERENQYDVALIRLPAEIAPGTLAEIAARPEANVVHPPGTYPVMLVTADGWRCDYRSFSERGGESLAGRWHLDLQAPGPAVLPGLGRAALVSHDPLGILDTGLREFVLGRLAAAATGARETQARIGGGSEGVSIEELDAIRLTAASLAALDRQIEADVAANRPVPMMYPTEGTLAAGRWLSEQRTIARQRLPGLIEARAAMLTRYPMLARISDLDAFTAKEDDEQVAALAATLPSVLQSIADLRAGLVNGSIDLWDYPEIVDAGLEAMGIEDQGLRDAAVARYRWEGRKELATDLGLALLGLVLGLGAAFASGGLALAFAGAALVVDTGDAMRQTARADLQLALANSDVDPTQALVPGDLSGQGVTVWLAWAGVVLDTVQLVQVARAVQRGMDLAKATRLVAAAEGLDPADLTRLLEQASTTFEVADDPTLVRLASLLQVPVVMRQDLPRGVWVTFATDALGGVKDIAVVLGRGATEADLLGHVATVQRLQEWVGAAGWVRGAWARARGQVRAGQLGFEAVLELEKLDAMVHLRQVLIERQPLVPGVTAALEDETDDLLRQRERFAGLVHVTEQGAGVVAATVANMSRFKGAYTAADSLERALRFELASRPALDAAFVTHAESVLKIARDKRQSRLEEYAGMHRTAAKAQYGRTTEDAASLVEDLNEVVIPSLERLRSDPRWGAGMPPQKEAIVRGAQITAEETRALQNAVVTALEGEVFEGQRVGYRGSLYTGVRGEHKARVAIDPAASDVDLYVIHPGLFNRLRPLVDDEAAEGGKIFLATAIRVKAKLDPPDQALIAQLEKQLERILVKLRAEGTKVHPDAIFERSEMAIRATAPSLR